MKLGKINWYQLFLYGALVLLAVQVLVLVRENKQLKEMVMASGVEQVKAGSEFANIDVTTLAGDPAQIDFRSDSRSTILFVFSTNCKYCSENLPNWQSIYERHKDTYRFVAISDSPPGDTQKYVFDNNLTYPVYLPQDSNFRKEYQLAGVPETLIINSDGIVENVWLGLLQEDAMNDLQVLLASTN